MMHQDISRVLFSESEILERVNELAAEITRDYHGRELTVIAILNGSFIFMADLLRRVSLPLQLDGWRVASYHGARTTGQVDIRQHDLADIRGRHVLLLDDILDTGLTLTTVRQHLESNGALSTKICVLLRKNVDRLTEIPADYVGFDIANEFVVGYGLDYNEHYRNLPYIGVLDPRVIAG